MGGILFIIIVIIAVLVVIFYTRLLHRRKEHSFEGTYLCIYNEILLGTYSTIYIYVLYVVSSPTIAITGTR